MFVLYANIALLFFWKLIFLSSPKKNGTLFFCIIASFQWFVIAGFRAWDVGADMVSYQMHFVLSSSYGFDSVINNFFALLSEGKEPLFDPGYDLLILQPIHFIGGDFQWMLMWIAAILSVSVGHFIYRHSDDCFMSFIIFSTVFASMLPLGGLRQSIALSLVVFWGYDFVVKRKPFKFFLLIILAFTIHPSAVVFAPFYFLSRVQVNSKIVLSWIILGVALVALSPILYPYLAKLLGYGSFEFGYVGRSTWFYTALFVTLAAIVLLQKKRILALYPHANAYIVALMIICLSLPFVFMNSNALRAGWYYMVFLMPFIPCIIGSFEEKLKPSVTIVVIVVAIACLAFTAPLVIPDSGYRFFFT